MEYLGKDGNLSDGIVSTHYLKTLSESRMSWEIWYIHRTENEGKTVTRQG